MTEDRVQTTDHKRRIGEALSGENGPSARLTWGQVREIRATHVDGGVTIRQLSERYGVGETTINDIVLNKTWRI